MHKYTFFAVLFGHLLNLHFLTKVLTLIICILKKCIFIEK